MTDLHREKFAALHRLLALEHLHEGSWGHCSARVPGEDLIMISPGQTHWSRIRASDILLLDPKGHIVRGQGVPNPSAWAVHGPILRARPDAHCIIHSHPPYATALTLLDSDTFDDCADQNAAMFYNKHAFLDHYAGVVTDTEEGDLMAAALGQKSVLFLRNHGVLLLERDIGLAFTKFYCLERACRVQLLTRHAGLGIKRMPTAAAELTAQYDGVDIESHFDAMLHVLDHAGADYRS
jgi:ribulose-5-phosphate 4-epimerase/fuculose-1-phosphate aldolase